jgi:menaquinone-dependent protoporphyrinogen IX oxidase
VNTLVVHASKYGSAQRYAEWIGEALGAPVTSIDEVKSQRLASRDTVVLCSPIYGPQLRGSRDLRRAMELETATRWVLVTVGLSDPVLSTKRDELVASKFSPELRQRLTVMHVRGAMDRDRLNVVERSALSVVRRSLKAKQERTTDEQAMLDVLELRRVDFTDRAAVAAVVEACLG